MKESILYYIKYIDKNNRSQELFLDTLPCFENFRDGFESILKRHFNPNREGADKVLEILISPVITPQMFSDNLGPQQMTDIHLEEYMKSLVANLQNYSSIIDRNLSLNPKINMPEFDIDIAQEISQRTYEESLEQRGVLKSYHQKYGIEP